MSKKPLIDRAGQTAEILRIHGELQRMNNSLRDVDKDIKTATDDDPLVCAHLTALYNSIDSLQKELVLYDRKNH